MSTEKGKEKDVRSSLERENGYYHILMRGIWEIAYYTGEGEWEYHCYTHYLEEDDIQKVGPYIPTLDEVGNGN